MKNWSCLDLSFSAKDPRKSSVLLVSKQDFESRQTEAAVAGRCHRSTKGKFNELQREVRGQFPGDPGLTSELRSCRGSNTKLISLPPVSFSLSSHRRQLLRCGIECSLIKPIGYRALLRSMSTASLPRGCSLVEQTSSFNLAGNRPFRRRRILFSLCKHRCHVSSESRCVLHVRLFDISLDF